MCTYSNKYSNTYSNTYSNIYKLFNKCTANVGCCHHIFQMNLPSGARCTRISRDKRHLFFQEILRHETDDETDMRQISWKKLTDGGNSKISFDRLILFLVNEIAVPNQNYYYTGTFHFLCFLFTSKGDKVPVASKNATKIAKSKRS